MIRGHRYQGSNFAEGGRSINRYYEVRPGVLNDGLKVDLDFHYFENELNANSRDSLGFFQFSPYNSPDSVWLQKAKGSVPQPISATLESLTKFTLANAFLVDVASFENTNLLINIFPNPTKGNVNLVVKGFSGHELKIQIYSLTGQRLLEDEFLINNDQQTIPLNLENKISPGIYIIRCQSGMNSMIQKLEIY